MKATTKPAAKKAKPASKKHATKKTKPASKTTAAKPTTYATAEAAVKAALADGRERTAVIQVGPRAFTLGSRRAALKHGYTVLGRAVALAAK